jgi:hypothetical protein
MKHPAELPEVDPVHLKPFLGMQPGLYLLILYLLLIAAVLFVIGFLPGVVRGGRYVTFQGTLSDWACRGLSYDSDHRITVFHWFGNASDHGAESGYRGDAHNLSSTIRCFHLEFHRTITGGTPITEALLKGQECILRFDLAEIARYLRHRRLTGDGLPPCSKPQIDVEELGNRSSVLVWLAPYITSTRCIGRKSSHG